MVREAAKKVIFLVTTLFFGTFFWSFKKSIFLRGPAFTPPPPLLVVR